MKNIFENAYFGKPYKTRDGRKAIYNGRSIDRHWLIVEQHPWNIIGFNSCGRHSGLEEDIDIVSEWQESVDEDRLNAILDEAEEMRETAIGRHQTGGWYWRRWAEWGYRKAKE